MIFYLKKLIRIGRNLKIDFFLNKINIFIQICSCYNLDLSLHIRKRTVFSVLL